MNERINIDDIRQDNFVKIKYHGMVANNRSAALVGVDGTVDWLCLPNFSSDPVFDSILDSFKGGSFQTNLRNMQNLSSEQNYIDDTLVLETKIYHNNAQIILMTDFMPVTDYASINFPELHRIIEAVEDCEIEVIFKPTMDYMLSPKEVFKTSRKVIFRKNDRISGLFSSMEIDWIPDDGKGIITLKKGQKCYLVISYGMRREDRIENYQSEYRLKETIEYWKNFASLGTYEGIMKEVAMRSAITLRSLFHDPSGMMVAAPTSSLPECIGGERNWDYRFSWVRDTSYVIQALAMMGFKQVSTNYLYDMMDIIESQGDIKVLYGIERDSVLREKSIDYSGYLGSKPVRIGNLAAEQFQLDVYGSFINAIYNVAEIGGIVNSYMWDFIVKLLDKIEKVWNIPDSSIWEFRTEPKHYTYSKIMCWLGFDRAIKLGHLLNFGGNYKHWETVRDTIKQDILTYGVDQETGSFVQYYGSTDVDSSLIRIPLTGFLPPDDPICKKTVERIKGELMNENYLFRRYNNDDGLKCKDNAFLLMSFWYVEYLTETGETEEARKVLEKIISYGNHLYLFSEEVEMETNELIGNFPQAITHLGVIRSICRLNEVMENN
ncbi:MAG: glycoside hydrolase family 15 protein [Candidatus Thermoplasmatota archaeon]|nr:glycoside hydrolase family 15 protein [Candidatus Thermoplasmatota archaeon]